MPQWEAFMTTPSFRTDFPGSKVFERSSSEMPGSGAPMVTPPFNVLMPEAASAAVSVAAAVRFFPAGAAKTAPAGRSPAAVPSLKRFRRLMLMVIFLAWVVGSVRRPMTAQ